MGFIKVAILATFGECLKYRGKTGFWAPPYLFDKFIIWGLYGMWFTLVFPIFSFGAQGVIENELWFGFWPAFSKSLFINSCYAYGMMLSHEYINKMIEFRGFLSAERFKQELDANVWFPSKKWGSVPWTIVWFWIPAHTVTFMLPEHFRILSAAFLAVVLGFILTTAGGKK